MLTRICIMQKEPEETELCPVIVTSHCQYRMKYHLRKQTLPYRAPAKAQRQKLR
jgi:hypothetical protein